MKKLIFTLLVGVFAVGASATELTFEQFKESCKDPNYQGQQRPPEKIKVLCSNVHYGWQPIEAAPFELASSRILTGELFSDKYHVGAEDFNVNSPETVGSCPRFREVVSTATVEQSLTCSQVINDDRDLEDICLDIINDAINSNPDIVETAPTGTIYNPCDLESGDGDETQTPNN